MLHSILRKSVASCLPHAARGRIQARPQCAIPDLLALSFLLLLAVALIVRPIVLGGTVYDEDIVLQSMPVYRWFSEALREGSVPIWCPFILGGFPVAFGQYSFFYPPDILLFRLLDAARAFHLSLALHLALAGGCCYWYCRVLKLRRLPSLVAAVAFQMGSEVLAWPANGFITRTLFVLPALLATIELTFTRRVGYWLLVPLIVGAGMLGGYAQIVLFGLVVAGAYAAVTVIVGWRKVSLKSSLQRLFLLAFGVGLGLGLSAVRVLPTLAVTAISTRSGGMGLDRTMIGSMQPWALLLGYLFPPVFELPGLDISRADYLGIPVLLLALLAAMAPRRIGRVGAFHLGLAVVATLLSLGGNTPFYPMLLQFPFFSYFNGPDRLGLVAALALSVLAAFALDRRMVLDLSMQRRRFRAVVVAAIVAVVGAIVATLLSLSFQFGRDPVSESIRSAALLGGWDLLNLFRPRVAAVVFSLVAAPLLALAAARRWFSHLALEWAYLVIGACTLFILGWVQYAWQPHDSMYQRPAFLSSLEADSSRFRVFAWAPRISTYNLGVLYGQLLGHQPPLELDDLYLRQFIPPDLSMLFGVSTEDGYEALQSRRQALLAKYMGSDRTDPAGFAEGGMPAVEVLRRQLADRVDLLAALNVRYVINPYPIDDPRLESVDVASIQIHPELLAMARIYAYRVREAVPRSYLVPTARTVDGERQVLDALLTGSVSLREEVLLEGTPPSMDGPHLTLAGSSVEITHYGNEQVSLRASTNGSGFLVLMDSPMPGWSVMVDGQPEQILPANFAGRAVPMRGPGEHLIEFKYQAPLLNEGLAISMVSLVVVALSVPASLWWQRRGIQDVVSGALGSAS